jgi:hypothetical protein
MDSDRLDGFRTFDQARSRRQALRTLAGAALGAVLAAPAIETLARRRQVRKEGKPLPASRVWTVVPTLPYTTTIVMENVVDTWFRYQVPKKGVTKLNANTHCSSSFDPDTDFDTVLGVYDKNNVLIAENDDSGEV